MKFRNKLPMALAALFAGALALPAQIPTSSVSLSWAPSLSDGVAGYNLYYGGASRIYTNSVDAGTATIATIAGLKIGATYYFAVTAYNSLGIESSYSNEAIYTVVAGAQPYLQISVVRGQVALTGTGLAGTNYDILASQNMSNWSVIGSMTANSNGTFQFTDPAGASHPRCLYRLKQH